MIKMSERPNVTVVFQDAKPANQQWTCGEVVLSALVLAGIALATGWWTVPWLAALFSP
jgi:hypothetical protein